MAEPPGDVSQLSASPAPPSAAPPPPCKSSFSGNTHRYCDGTFVINGASREVKRGDVGGTAYERTKKDAAGRVLLYATEYWDSSLDDEGRPETGLFIVFDSGKCQLGEYSAGKKNGAWRIWTDETQCQAADAKKQGVKNGDPKFAPLPPRNRSSFDDFEAYTDGAPAQWPDLARAVDETKPRRPFGYKVGVDRPDGEDGSQPDGETRAFLRAFQSVTQRHPESAGTPEYKALADKQTVLQALWRLTKKESEKATTGSTNTGLNPQEVAELKSLCEKDGQSAACLQYGEHHVRGDLAQLDWFERACKLADHDACQKADVWTKARGLQVDAKLKARRREILLVGCKIEKDEGSTPIERIQGGSMCKALAYVDGGASTSASGCSALTGRHVVSNGPNFSVACEKPDGPACVARKVGTGAVTEAQVRAAAPACCCDVH